MLLSMHAVKNIAEVDGLVAIATDLAELLARPDNADVAVEFPVTAARYSGDIQEVVRKLQQAQEDCSPGVRQQFIAFAGEQAVGMSVVCFADELPDGIDPSWPNLSGFICNPYRNQGLGRLSLLQRLQTVDEQFGGRAWTRIKKTNVFSNRMVTHAGLSLIGHETHYNVYTYHSEKH